MSVVASVREHREKEFAQQNILFQFFSIQYRPMNYRWKNHFCFRLFLFFDDKIGKVIRKCAWDFKQYFAFAAHWLVLGDDCLVKNKSSN